MESDTEPDSDIDKLAYPADGDVESDVEEGEESAEVAEAREWIEDEDEEQTAVDIMRLITQALQEVKSLQSHRAMKLVMHLTAVSDYVKLQ